MMLMMLGLGGWRALEMRYKPNKTLKMHAVGSVRGCKYSEVQLWARTWSACTENHV